MIERVIDIIKNKDKRKSICLLSYLVKFRLIYLLFFWRKAVVQAR